MVFEIGVIKNAINHCFNEIDEFAKPRKVTPQLQMRLSYSAYVQYQPYGVVLVIGAWNYPYQLCLVPLVGAIAAGNCVLVKPSELSPASAKLMAKLIPQYLDNDCVKVFNGGAEETKQLLTHRFDYIMYTGSTAVGKIIMEAASKHMTPVTLECGGKSPVFIDASADLAITAKRLSWAKFANAGQTCIAPDYVICTRDTLDRILPLIKAAIKEFYGEDAKSSKSFARIINARHFKRVKDLIDTNKVYYGGDFDEAARYIAPTMMINCTTDDAVMKEEIFGPVLPFVLVKDAAEAIDFINKGEKPLALYVFSNHSDLYDEFLERTTSGSYAYNDCLVQCALECLPFGGVGQSGIGAYHGSFSIETFSHKRAVLKGSFFGDNLMAFRYPPYTNSKMKQASLATATWKNGILSALFKKDYFYVVLLVALGFFINAAGNYCDAVRKFFGIKW